MVTACSLPIYLLLLLHLQLYVAADNRTTLHIAVLIPFAHVDHSCTKHAIDMAVEDVNNKKGFIKNFVKNEENRLQVHYVEIGANKSNGIEALYSFYENKPIKISMIGPPYDNQNEFCAEISTVRANLHISYSEPYQHPTFKTPFYSHITPYIISNFIATRNFVDRFNWTQVGIIFDYAQKQYQTSVEYLRTILENKNSQNKTTKVLSTQGIWGTPSHYSVSTEINTLQTQGARIVFALVSINGARKIFCEAYKKGMVKPKVTWFLFEKLPKDWATDKYNPDGLFGSTKREVDCTPEEMMIAARGYISIVKQGIRIDGETTIGNQTKESYEKRLREAAQYDKCDESVAYAYDSIWVLAKTYQIISTRIDISKYSYYDYLFTRTLSTLLVSVNFEGITGPLIYKKHKELNSVYSRFGQISIWSHPDDKTDLFIGRHDTVSNNLSLSVEANKDLFDYGKVPNDKTNYVFTFANIPLPLLIAMWVVSILGIILALVFLAITLYHVSSEHITLDSPVINGVIVFGCISTYLSVLAYSIDTRFVAARFVPETCWVFLILLSGGFTMTFGSLFAKAWKYYKQYIAPEIKVSTSKKYQVNNSSLNKYRSVPDVLLYLMVGIFVAVDIVIFVTWYAISPFEYVIKNITSTENLFADTIYLKQIASCSCKYETEFIIGVYSYKGLLLIFGTFLGWQARNSQIKMPNEPKQIGMAIYNVVAVSLIGVICVSVLANTIRYEASYAVIAVCICICNTTTLLLFFLPKLRRLFVTLTLKKEKNESGTKPNSDVS